MQGGYPHITIHSPTHPSVPPSVLSFHPSISTNTTTQQDSRLVHREGNADQLVWFQLGVFSWFQIDVLMEAYGADLMLEGTYVRGVAWRACVKQSTGCDRWL